MKAQPSEKIGAAIRKLRIARGWTLAELSDQCGVPLSTLSRLELGQTALNYDKLMRLCRALDVDLQGLVAREAEGVSIASGRRSVIRAGEGEPVKVGGHAGLRGAADLLGKSLTPVILDLGDDPGPFRTLDGEAYVLVLEGEAVLHSQLYTPLTLRRGDAVYFDGRSPHALASVGGGRARALLVVTGEPRLDD